MAKLWVTYAWKDNEDGDFNFMISALEEAGVSVEYDRVALIPGKRLWDQISDRIIKGDLDGWAYLLTPNSVQRQAPREELAYALERALSVKDSTFPLIGLVHQLDFDDVPPALKVRLCVSLSSPDWIEEVRAALEQRPPRIPPEKPHPFKVAMHSRYLGQEGTSAFEIRPRFGEMRNWRLGWPAAGPAPRRCGVGTADGGGLSGVQRDVLEGTIDIDGETYKFEGAGDPISASASAYLIFVGQMPQRLIFGVAKGPMDVPAQWWKIKAAD